MERGWKKVRRAVAALLSGGLLWLAPVASAENGAVGAVSGVLGGIAMYNIYVGELLRSGNRAVNQAGLRAMDARKNGVDTNPANRELVDRIMRQLVAEGHYVMDIRALPFRWQVNGKKEFNASCYLSDYISVNQGAIRQLDRNEDELAAVLGHEMTHGNELHVVFSTAKKMAILFGTTIANVTTGGHIRPDALAMMVMGGSAQSFELPDEEAADEGGFFVMSSAGFNPGGGAAAMVVLAHVTELEKANDLLKDQDDPKYKILQNHPDTEKREQKLAELMSSYSCGHVRVQDGKEVTIDGAVLLEAGYTREDFNNSRENAYLIAGALAKAFHDYDSLEGWGFRPGENGRWEFLDDSRVYRVLKEAVEANKADARLYEFVRSAYIREEDGRLRKELAKFMAAREEKLEKLRKKNRETDAGNVERLYRNADEYNDVFCPELALKEAERLLAYPDKEKLLPGYYAVRGRAKALQGDYAGGTADCDRALELQPEGDAFLYLNRAEVSRLQGRMEEVLAFCARAEAQGSGDKSKEDKLIAVYKMQGDIYSDLGKREQALERYRLLLKKAPDFQSLPLSYLQELAPKNAEKVKKQLMEEIKQELGDKFKTPEERKQADSAKKKKNAKEQQALEKGAKRAAKNKEKQGTPQEEKK